MGKIKTALALAKTLQKLQAEGKTVVFTNGCFDLLHPGHLKVLQEAKKCGDILVVGLNSDTSVRRLKGTARPVLPQRARAQLVAALGIVDYVVIFSEPTPYKLIKQLRPDYLLKGEDWGAGAIVGRNLVRKVFRVPLYSGYSTTKIINKIHRS